MDDIDRRLIQDKQDQLLAVAKNAMAQQKEINRLSGEVNRLRRALMRIAAYQPPEQLRHNSENEYGLSYEKALEMAYENIQSEAKAALESSA